MKTLLQAQNRVRAAQAAYRAATRGRDVFGEAASIAGAELDAACLELKTILKGDQK